LFLMAKESMIDKVIRLMKHKENIRNMGIVAHTFSR